jgi:subtilisin family serine protease
MKEKHVILRTRGTSLTRGPFSGPSMTPFGFESAAGAIEIDIDDIERSRISALSRDREVVAIAPVMPLKLIAPVQVADVDAPAGQTITWGVKAVGADTSPFTGDGVVVAVLDTGIDAAHSAFSGVQIVEKDFTGEGNGDQHGHGTHCAGTILGRDTENTRIGVARGVKKAVIGKVLGSQGGSTDQIFRAITWAIENGANVISMSLGMDFPGYVKALMESGLPAEPAASRGLEGYRANVLLFDRLALVLNSLATFAQPVVLVAAAGNESERPTWEIAVSPPAVAEGVISVAALGEGAQGLEVARFSNTGADVSGPGVNVTSARAGGGLRSMSGTSMATPHVAGVAALWAEKLSKQGQFTSDHLTARVVGNAAIASLKPGFDPSDVGAGLVVAPQQ